MDQLGNPESKSSTFIEQYTMEMELRYRHSPAIWGWKFGNEYSLHTDLPNTVDHRPKIVPQLETALKRTSKAELALAATHHYKRFVIL